MSAQALHAAALRIPVLHILRAAGFHSTKPAVLDTLVNITERFLCLLASRTASHALANHNSMNVELEDARMALVDAGILLPVHGATEERWTEDLRRLSADYDTMVFGDVRRDKEMQRRQDDDTADVRAFIEWITGDRYKEIRRVANMLPDATAPAGPGRVAGAAGDGMSAVGQDDFLVQLKKRNRVAVDEERWLGTVLGAEGDGREFAIEGGEAESVAAWESRLRAKMAKASDLPKSAAAVDAMEIGLG